MEKVPCECADDLNYGEPAPDCHACGGSGMRLKDKAPDGPIFNFPKEEARSNNQGGTGHEVS